MRTTVPATGGLNQLGSGTTTLTGTNTYAGTTNVNAGTLQGGAANTFSPNSTHNVVSGATLDLNSFAQVVGALSGAGNVLLGANLTAGGNNASTTFSGGMTGAGGFTKTGTGTLVLSGASNYTGGTTLAQGTLRIEHNQALGSGALTTTGSVLDYANAVTLANPIVIGSNTTQLNVGAGTATQAGAIAETGGARPLEKTGAGTLVLAGANSYAGATSVTAGTLQAGAANVLAPSSAFTVASGATLDLAGHSQTIGSLAGAGAVGLGAALLTAGGDNSSTNFAGVVSGSGGLTKAGTGTLTLSGTNTYTGTTTINAGTLSVNGAIAGPVTVNSGATLGGTGTIGSTTVNNGGVFAPGNSIGTITVDGNLVLGAGSIYRVELSPTSSDRTNVTGTATLGGTAQLVFGPGSYSAHSYTILSAAGGRSRHVRHRDDRRPAGDAHRQSQLHGERRAARDADLADRADALRQYAQPEGRRRPRRTRRSTAALRTSRRCTISRSASFPPRSMRSPARCTRAPPVCCWMKASKRATRCSDGCARPPMAVRAAWRRSRSADRRRHSPTRRSTRRSPMRSRRSSPRRR